VRLESGLEMKTTLDAISWAVPIRRVGFKSIANLKSSGLFVSMLGQTPPA